MDDGRSLANDFGRLGELLVRASTPQEAGFFRLLAVGIHSPPPSVGPGLFDGLKADVPPDLDCAGGGGRDER